MKRFRKMTSFGLFLLLALLALASCSDSNTVEVSFWANDTKAEWLH